MRFPVLSNWACRTLTYRLKELEQLNPLTPQAWNLVHLYQDQIMILTHGAEPQIQVTKQWFRKQYILSIDLNEPPVSVYTNFSLSDPIRLSTLLIKGYHRFYDDLKTYLENE